VTDRRTEIIAKLEENLNNFIFFFRSLSDEQLSVQVYTDGAKWTVKQVLAHFITIERSMHWLFKDILSGGSGSPDGFDSDLMMRAGLPGPPQIISFYFIWNYFSQVGSTAHPAPLRRSRPQDAHRSGVRQLDISNCDIKFGLGWSTGRRKPPLVLTDNACSTQER
jgi:hypothetical protein